MKYFISCFFILTTVLSFSCKQDRSAEQKTEKTETFSDAASYYDRARQLMQDGKYPEAIADVESGLKIDSLNPDAYHLLADAYLDGAESRKALAVMEKVTQMFPKRTSSMLKYAEFQYILRQYDNSILTLNEILRYDELNPEAYFMLGMNFRDMGDTTRAINSFKTAVENDPEIVDGWIALGDIHKGKKEGEQYYKNAVSVSNNTVETLHSLAYYYQHNNRITDALDIYREMTLIDKEYLASYMNAGILYLEKDSLDRAYEQFNILVGMRPENYKGYYFRSQVWLLRGNKEKALEDVETSLRLNPNSTDAIRLKNEIDQL